MTEPIKERALETLIPETNFNFDIPLEITKGKTEDEWRIRGKASDERQDLQGEIVRQNSLDISALKEGRGLLNWDHKDGPINTIGVIDEAEIKEDGLHIAGYLFKNHDQAKATYDILRSLKSTDKRRLGLSIEGKILKRSGIDGRIISAARIEKVAVTFSPVNTSAYCELVKSLTADYTPNASEIIPPVLNMTVMPVKEEVLVETLPEKEVPIETELASVPTIDSQFILDTVRTALEHAKSSLNPIGLQRPSITTKVDSDQPRIDLDEWTSLQEEIANATEDKDIKKTLIDYAGKTYDLFKAAKGSQSSTHKYIRRTGTAGAYKYWYKLPNGHIVSSDSANGPPHVDHAKTLDTDERHKEVTKELKDEEHKIGDVIEATRSKKKEESKEKTPEKKESKSEYPGYRGAEEFLNKVGVKMSTKFVSHGPYFAGEKESRDIFNITLTSKDGKKAVFAFGGSIKDSTESGDNPPNAHDALSSLASDAQAGEYDSVTEFGKEFGYELDTPEDRRNAQKVYTQLKANQDKLMTIFGDNYEKLLEESSNNFEPSTKEEPKKEDKRDYSEFTDKEIKQAAEDEALEHAKNYYSEEDLGFDDVDAIGADDYDDVIRDTDEYKDKLEQATKELKDKREHQQKSKKDGTSEEDETNKDLHKTKIEDERYNVTVKIKGYNGKPNFYQLNDSNDRARYLLAQFPDFSADEHNKTAKYHEDQSISKGEKAKKFLERAIKEANIEPTEYLSGLISGGGHAKFSDEVNKQIGKNNRDAYIHSDLAEAHALAAKKKGKQDKDVKKSSSVISTAQKLLNFWEEHLTMQGDQQVDSAYHYFKQAIDQGDEASVKMWLPTIAKFLALYSGAFSDGLREPKLPVLAPSEAANYTEDMQECFMKALGKALGVGTPNAQGEGGYNVPPSTLTGGAVLERESLDRKRKKKKKKVTEPKD